VGEQIYLWIKRVALISKRSRIKQMKINKLIISTRIEPDELAEIVALVQEIAIEIGMALSNY
jgi:hypothetical protein